MSYQPTIIGASLIKTEPKKVYEPTKISVAEPQLTNKKFEVTAMKGHVRKGLDPEKYDLERRFRSLSPFDIDVLKRKISNIIPELMTPNECTLIGKDNQLTFTNSIDFCFELTNSPCIAHAQRHVERLIAILTGCVSELEKTDSFWKKVDVKAILAKVISELNLLKKLLIQSMDELLLVKDKTIRSMHSLDQLKQTLIVDLALIDVVETELHHDCNAVLLQRNISIGTTITQLTNQCHLIESMASNLSNLMNLISSAIVSQIPALLQTIMAATQAEMNDTQKYLITDSLKTFITSLKKDIS